MAEITAEMIQKILDISRAEIYTLPDAIGRVAPFSSKPLKEVKADPPAVSPVVCVTTLAGFADLIRANLDAETFKTDWLIHVIDERSVDLLQKHSDEYGRRTTLISAHPVSFKEFSFGQWMGQEEFVIAVASLFAETEDRAYVLSLGSTLTREAMMTSEDDGFTQKGISKAGLRTRENVTLKPRVALAPFRTFPELAQPVSEFVFRAKGRENEAPMLMLVEADGGRWKIDAIAEIKARMESFNLNIPIIA